MMQLYHCRQTCRIQLCLTTMHSGLSCYCRHELDITALTGCLEREEKARTEEAAEHATAAAALQKDIADLQASMH